MTRPGAFPVYLFDVDGTLMDSARDICGAIQQVLRVRGRADIPDSYLRKYIGTICSTCFSISDSSAMRSIR